MQRDREFFLDILEAAKLAISYVDDKSKEDFLRDSQCQDAVVRRFEIIGEASRRISDETRASHPELPWGEMMRGQGTHPILFNASSPSPQQNFLL